MTNESFTQTKLLAASLGRSPMAEVCADSYDRLRHHLIEQRSSAPDWLIYDWSDHLVSPISLLANKGVQGFFKAMEHEYPTDRLHSPKPMTPEPELEELLKLFFLDVVRVEWEFAKMIDEKPEHTDSYVRQLSQAYKKIAQSMKEELPDLPWVCSLGIQRTAPTKSYEPVAA